MCIRDRIDAIELILSQERARGDWLDEPVDLAFTTQLWRKTITHRTCLLYTSRCV